MPVEADLEYFTRRAREERQKEREAKNVLNRRLHRNFAVEYEMKISNLQSRQ